MTGVLISNATIEQYLDLHARRWGAGDQARYKEQALEEAAELIVAIQHSKRASRAVKGEEEIDAEMADLTLCLEGLYRVRGYSRARVLHLVEEKAAVGMAKLAATLAGQKEGVD